MGRGRHRFHPVVGLHAVLWQIVRPRGAGEAEKRAVAQELYNAFHTYGWIYLKDFGISADEIDEMFAAVSVTNSGGTSANVDRITEQEIL